MLITKFPKYKDIDLRIEALVQFKKTLLDIPATLCAVVILVTFYRLINVCKRLKVS